MSTRVRAAQLSSCCCFATVWFSTLATFVGLLVGLTLLHVSPIRVLLFPVLVWSWYILYYGLRAIIGSGTWLKYYARGTQWRPWVSNVDDDRQQFNVCGCWVFMIMLIFGIVHIVIADEANPGGWIKQSPCGSSSCSSESGRIDVTYNPNGWFNQIPRGFFDGPHRNYDDTTWRRPIFCLYKGCDWASPVLGSPQIRAFNRTNGTIAHYPDFNAECNPAHLSCANLASNRSQDYPDPGFGLANGFLSGFRTTQTTPVKMCPGVKPGYTLSGLPGVGKGICPYCLPYFRAKFGRTFDAGTSTASCPDNWADETSIQARDSFVCAFMCPQVCPNFGLGELCETGNPSDLQGIVVLWYVMAVIPLISWFIQEMMGVCFRGVWRNIHTKVRDDRAKHTVLEALQKMMQEREKLSVIGMTSPIRDPAEFAKDARLLAKIKGTTSTAVINAYYKMEEERKPRGCLCGLQRFENYAEDQEGKKLWALARAGLVPMAMLAEPVKTMAV